MGGELQELYRLATVFKEVNPDDYLKSMGYEISINLMVDHLERRQIV